MSRLICELRQNFPFSTSVVSTLEDPNGRSNLQTAPSLNQFKAFMEYRIKVRLRVHDSVSEHR